MSDDNMQLWNKYKDTDLSYTQQVKDAGREYTSISAQYQIRLATKEWGSMGKAWGVKSENFNHFDVGEKIDVQIKNNVTTETKSKLIMCNYTAILFYPNGEIPLHAGVQVSYVARAGYSIQNTNYSKIAATDALTKGLSKLGFSADIFLQEYEKNLLGNKPEETIETKSNDITKRFESAVKASSASAAKKKALLSNKSLSDDLKEKFINGQISL